MGNTSSLIAVATALASITLAADAVRADALETECGALDRTAQTSCRVDRADGDEWVLNTGYHVGSGRMAVVETVESRFCSAARRAGVRGRIVRTSEIPGVHGKGAVMELRCGMPAVSSAPRPR